MKLGTAEVLVKAKTDKFDKDIDKSKKKVDSFGKSTNKTLAGVSASFVSLAGIAGVGGLSASLVGLVSIGAKFESQMATVRGVMRASDKDFKALSDAAKKMGATTEWSSRQSAEALNFMGMAGYSAAQAIEALPGVLDLATAGGLDLGRASDIVTDSLTAMGLGVNELAGFSDVLIGTITRSNTNIEMLGESLKYAAPVASVMGYEIEQLAAMLGTLANAGIKASDAGTDLRQAMVRNAKAAKELGTAEDDLIGTLKAAKEAGWGVNEVTKNYGMIAAKSVLVLMRQLDGYGKLEKQLRNVTGETQKLAEIKLDTLAGDWQIFRSAVEGTSLEIFEDLNSSLRAAVKTATELLSVIEGIWKYSGLKFVWDFSGWLAEYPEDFRKMNEKIKKLSEETNTHISKMFEIPERPSLSVSVTGDAGKPTAKELKEIEQFAKIKKASLDTISRLTSTHYEYEVKKLGMKYKKELDLLVSNNQSTKELTRAFILELGEITAAETGKEDALVKTKLDAYMDLYNDFGVMTQESYDQLYNQYAKDRDDFIKLTGDKETAYALFTDRLNALNEEFELNNESWLNSAQKGLENYAESASDVFSSIENATTSAFSSMEDAIVDFAMTGKLNFADFAKSIISDMIRIMIQSQITAPLAGAAGSFLGSMFGGLAGGAAVPTSGVAGGGVASSIAPMAMGGVLDGGFQEFANGGIVNRPTFGLVGEGRYNEAVIPLPDGKNVPVKMQGSAGGTTIVNNITVESSGGDEQQDMAQAHIIASMIDQKIKQTLVTEQRPGGVLHQGAY